MIDPTIRDEKISAALKAKLDEALGDKTLVCSVCGAHAWMFGPVIGPMVHRLGGNPDGKFSFAPASFPLVLLICQNCTNVLFFPALRLLAEEKK
jgi:hypothetical protein